MSARPLPRHSFDKHTILGFVAEEDQAPQRSAITPTMWAYLESEDRSEWVRFVVFQFHRMIGRTKPYEKMINHSDWDAIDELLANLPRLETVFIIFGHVNHLLHFQTPQGRDGRLTGDLQCKTTFNIIKRHSGDIWTD